MAYCHGNRWDLEFVSKLLLERGFYLLTTNINHCKQKFLFTDKEGYLYYSYLDLKFKYKPVKFHISNPHTIDNIKLWCKIENKTFELLDEQYVKHDNLLKWKCFRCGEVFEKSLTPILQHKECPYCSGHKVGISNCLFTNNPELCKEWDYSKNNLTPLDITYGSKKYAWWKCLKCGNSWKSKINNRNNGSGCPVCNLSKGEERILNFFKEYIHIDVYSQKYFCDLFGINGGLLTYDFFLPNYNLLIEYQGEHHDGTVPNQTYEQFEKRKEHDKRKREYAKNNNIQLLEIWYWDFKNIEEILTNALNLKEIQ